MARDIDQNDPESWDSFEIRKQLALGRIGEAQAQELLSNKGETLESPTPPDPRPGVSAVPSQPEGEPARLTESGYDNARKSELQTELDARGITYGSGLTNAELVDILRADDAGELPEA